MIQNIHVDTAQAAALSHWQTPFPSFTSGHDPRSSDNGLLTLLYGNLEQAADYHWLNAGRRLIDKTYIDMLWHTQALTNMRACSAEQIAAALDNFIQDTLRHQWSAIPDMNPAERETLAIDWVSEVSNSCFGSLHSELAASRLLFYLCPMLPIFNLSRGHMLVLDQMGYSCRADNYAAYSQVANLAYQELAPALYALAKPIAHFGEPAQQQTIRHMLDQSDWWPRRVFDELVHQKAQHKPDFPEAHFACDDGGQLMT